jgi:hypothetical protein
LSAKGCNHKENSTIGRRIWSDGICWKEPSVLTDAARKALKPKEPSPPPSLATLRFGQASDGGSEGMAQPDPMIDFAELDAHNFPKKPAHRHLGLCSGKTIRQDLPVALLFGQLAGSLHRGANTLPRDACYNWRSPPNQSRGSLA